MGRNIIGIIAAVLVFLGLIFLGILVIPALTNAIKIVLMYLLSAVLTAGGTLLTVKKKNYFTTALLGCGSGSFFISIMLTHVYFNVIGNITAYALLLVWMAISLVLVKLSDSLLMSILVHIGLTVSLCFAYYGGLGQVNMFVLVAYQLLAVALLTIGNIVCYRKTYRVGLLVSLLLSLVAVIAMFFYYAQLLNSFEAGQKLVVLSAFVVQSIGAAVLSYLLFVSVTEVENRAIRITLQLLNKALLIAILYISTYLFAIVFSRGALLGTQMNASLQNYSAHWIAAGIGLLISLVHASLSIFLQKKRNSDFVLELISVVTMCAYASQLMLIAYFSRGHTILHLSAAAPYMYAFGLPGIMLVAIALMAFNRLTARPLYALLALCVAGVDCILMIVGGYAELVQRATIFSALAYMLLYVAIIIYLWRRLEATQRQRLLTAVKVCLICVIELSFLSIMLDAVVKVVYDLLVLTIAFLVMLALRLDVRPAVPRGYWLFIRLHEIALTLLSSLYIANTLLSASALLVPTILLLLATVALLVWALLRVRAMAAGGYHWLGCLLGFVFTVLVVGTVTRHTNLLDEAYAMSIAIMATALVCVVAGFMTKIKPLRLYGLILVIISVLKLVTYDVLNAQSLMRVIAFIVGGLICFGISALYSYTVKRFEDKAARPER